MTTQSCFLCRPDENWVYSSDDKFFVMLVLGPLMEGYSILATKEHIPSMMDLSIEDTKHLCEFTQSVRKRLMPHYGDAVMTEHGRVAPCVDRDRAERKSHCFHAHRLVFPTSIDLIESFHEH